MVLSCFLHDLVYILVHLEFVWSTMLVLWSWLQYSAAPWMIYLDMLMVLFYSDVS
jgi:hypothetical protein